MKVAVDAMGGDLAPEEVVKGALIVAGEQPAVQIILVGDEPAINAELAKNGPTPANVSIRHTSEVIAMDDHPAQALRKKRDSSLVVAGQMVKNGEADATFSAGNTGAAMAIATLEIGRIKGIDRPAIGATMPAIQGRFLLLDAGANVDCSPENLEQFAIVGSIYAEKVMGIENPRVGLLNIGGEAGKGNELAKETYGRLSKSNLNFVGNIEGKEAYEGAADVIVCDGFAGNVLLKASEGVAEMIVHLIQKEFAAVDPAVQGSLLPLFGRLKQRIDYAETGGAPLLGVNGVSIIGHGRSKAKAIASGIRSALHAAESGFVGAIREALPKLHEGDR
jgi:glycerol-3-phosphate acyltransferase PlsX